MATRETQKEAQKEVQTEAQKEADRIIDEAEQRAAEMMKQTQKEIKKMIAEAQNTVTPISSVTIQAPQEQKSSLPEYIKEMQKNLQSKTDIQLFDDGDRYSGDVFVSVNGRHRFQIQRGRRVQVPRYIAAVEKASREQDLKTNRLMKEKQEEAVRRFSMLEQ